MTEYPDRKNRGMLLLTGALTAVSAYFLLTGSAAGEVLRMPESGELFLEMLFLAAALSACIRLPAKCSRVIPFICVISGYLWIHRVFVPLLVSGVYLAYLFLLGDVLAGSFRGRSPGASGSGPADFLYTGRRLLAGACAQLILTACFSAFGIGGAAFARLQVLVTGVPVLCLTVFRNRKMLKNRKPARTGQPFFSGFCSLSPAESLLLVIPVLSLLLQAGRMNIALDYDSLHYGLRSAFVLDNGGGIYQNLGSVNDVYVYPKGLETLCLPLCVQAGGAFVTAFSWWMTAGTLWGVYSLTVRKGNRIPGLCAAACAAAIPGIMNMSVSAKTDAATLFFQLLCAAEFTEAFRRLQVLQHSGAGARNAAPGFVCGLAAAVFTLTLKPTSYLFSLLLVAGAAVPALAGVTARKNGHSDSAPAAQTPAHKAQTPAHEAQTPAPAIQAPVFADLSPASAELPRALLILALSLIAAALITLRTVLLAGVPLTTAGGTLWSLLGFQRKYPFVAPASFESGGQSLLKRLIGVFACPVGSDMFHVYIAWGGLLPALCILRKLLRTAGRYSGAAVCRKKGGNDSGPVKSAERDLPELYLTGILAAVLAASVYCIGILYQVDGNYFILLYALSATAAFFCPGSGEPSAGSGAETEPRPETAFHRFVSLAPAVLLGLLMCALTNWAGVPGLSEPQLIHRGYVNRTETDRSVQTAQGTAELYAYLEARPRARVLAMEEQPACFAYRCNVQSYTDLEGGGGNVYLVKTLVLFKEYLDYAAEDYILTEDGFLAQHSRARDIVGYMLEDGSLEPVWEGSGRHLYRYRTGL